MNQLKLSFLLVFFLTISSFPSLTAQMDANNELASSPKFSIGISLGGIVSKVNSNQLAAPLTDVDFNTLSINKKWNEIFSVHLLYHMNEEYGIESGIFYDKKSIHLSGNNAGANEDKATNPSFKYEYLTIPLLFRKTMGKKNIKTTFHAGPYFSLLQSASYSNRTFRFIRDLNNNYIEIAEEEAFNLNNTAREGNFGILIKVGAEMEATEIITPFIQGFFSHSFSQADDFSNIREFFPDAVESDSKFSSFGISVGAYFRVK